MAAFLKDITPFLGTGERNGDGRSLKEFLEEYDSKKYECPCVTADILVIRHPASFYSVETGLSLLMIKRKNHPSIGTWALPGGFAEIRENLVDSARRELMEETNVRGLPLEQMAVWGDYDRDPRCRIITVSYLALVEEQLKEVMAGDDAADAAWMEITFRKEKEERFYLDGKEKKKTYYRLQLDHAVRGFSLWANTVCVENAGGLLKEEEYHVLEREGIAFDHPSMITQALRQLENRL